MTYPESSFQKRRSIVRQTPAALAALAQRIKVWGYELGFDAIGITDTDIASAQPGFLAWLEAGFHGEMAYMKKNLVKRLRPSALVPGAVRVICARLSYLPTPTPTNGHWRLYEHARLADSTQAVVSIYARGRDYHKVMRQRLQKLAQRIEAEIGRFGYRVFTDSAPVCEVTLAQKAGLGWRGKHTLLLQRDVGSMFFLGEIYVDIPLPVDMPADVNTRNGAHCGQCTRCIDICPTRAIVAPYRLDARRCISYLTIELKGSIPEPLRPLIGNRVYGCDDCQLACPWNKFAQPSRVGDFEVRQALDRASLLELFDWSEAEFDTRLAGSAIRRIGYVHWLRNIAVALGNALRATRDVSARARLTAVLSRRAQEPSALVREHVQWALQQGE